MTLTCPLVVGLTPFARRVLDAVDQIPVGRVLAYSDVAELIGAGSGRSVGTVMARYGDEVPWHRVLHSDGSCAERTRSRQLRLLREEGVAMRGDRVVMSEARWGGGAIGDSRVQSPRGSTQSVRG